MIVRIDEPGKNQEPIQVYVFGPGRRIGKCGRQVEDTGYAIALDLYRRVRSDPWSHRAPGSANYELGFRDQMTILDHSGASLSAGELHSWVK
jgi:hypothetical protein